MTKPDSTRLPGLDTLRSLAIAAVMLYHLQGMLPESWRPVEKFGWMGVDLFFVLSGYLIGYQVLKPYAGGGEASLREFYRRRAYRILPAYLAVLAIYFLVPMWREHPGISPLWEFLTFTENLLVDYSRNQAFSHVWSLCVEEHFYLVLPVLVLLLMKRPSMRRALLAAGAVLGVGMVVRAFVLVHTLRPLGVEGMGVKYIEDIYYPTWTRLDGLLVGVLLASMRVFRPEWWAWLRLRGHASVLSGVVLVGVAMWIFKDRFDSLYGVAAWGTVVGFPVLSAGLGLIVASGVSANGWLARVRVPGAKMVATLAFSLYLTHKGIAHLDSVYLDRLTGDNDWKAAALLAVTCIAGAGVLYGCVERPFLRLRESRGGRGVMRLQDDPAL